MNKMNNKDFFEFGKQYLLSKPEINVEILNYYMNLWERRKPKTFEELCRNMIEHSQNRRGMPNSIGKVSELKTILFDFNPSLITDNFKNWDILFDYISKNNYKTKGNMTKENPHNYWVLFTKNILSISKYLLRFGSLSSFNQYVSVFDVDNPEIRLSLPLILSQEKLGYGFALACDFIKENVSPRYIKPDTHIRDIFIGVGICHPSDNDLAIFRKVVAFSDDIQILPYSVDRLFWLIGSGKLFETEDRKIIPFKTNKDMFIKEWILNR
jgi:hypothetical protein